LPSQSHPIVAQLDEQLLRLKSSEAASTSYSAISQNLGSLKSLYEHLDEMLTLPLNQASPQTWQAKWVDLVLDGSLRLLDLCDVAKDALSQTKECLQDIQSLLRRRSSDESGITNEIIKFMNTRKKIKKAIKGSFKDVKTSDKHDESDAIVSLLRGVEESTSGILRSLASYVAGKKTLARKTNWFNKLVLQSNYEKETATTSGFEAFDEALKKLLVSNEKKTGFNVMEVKNLRSDIMKLESEIEDLDESLDHLCRHLIKTRATVLNVLSN